MIVLRLFFLLLKYKCYVELVNEAVQEKPLWSKKKSIHQWIKKSDWLLYVSTCCALIFALLESPLMFIGGVYLCVYRAYLFFFFLGWEVFLKSNVEDVLLSMLTHGSFGFCNTALSQDPPLKAKMLHRAYPLH